MDDKVDRYEFATRELSPKNPFAVYEDNSIASVGGNAFVRKTKSSTPANTG